MPTTIISTASCALRLPPASFPSLPFPNPNRLSSPSSPVKAPPFSNHHHLLLHFRAAAPLLSTWIHKTSSCRQIFPSLALANHSFPDTDSVWEAPDYGSDSDDEEENKEQEKEEGSYYVEKTAQVIQYEEKLRKEVELLLSPEERAIFQHNVTAALDKIATAKWIPLHTLALSIQIPFMDKLIESGFDVDVADKDGYTALHKAVIGKKEAVISHLLRKGANPHVRDKDGATPLHYAVLVGAIQTVKLLIKYKVDVNAADNEGWTPLHVAIQARCRDIAKILLVNGADKTRRNKDGKLPLDLSLCYGRDFKSYELAKLLKVVPAES